MAPMKQRDDEGRVESAGQLRGLSWEGVRQTALGLVENFCQRYHMNPAEFLSNLGFMRSDSWRQGVDWRSCVNWNQFNSLIFNAIPAQREREFDADSGRMSEQVVGRRFDQARFMSELRAMRESYQQNAAPQARQEGPQAREERPAARRQAEPPAAARPRGPMSDAVWSRAYSEAETIMDRFPSLTEEHRDAIHGILDRGGRESERRLVSVNLTEYLRYLSDDLHTISSAQATSIYDAFLGTNPRSPGLVLQAEAWMRQEAIRPAATPSRIAGPREAPSPAREEMFVYRVQIREGGTVLSTFEVASPTRIENPGDLSSLLRERPDGLVVTRIGASGRRITVRGEQLDLFENRMGRLRFDPAREISITEQKERRPRA